MRGTHHIAVAAGLLLAACHQTITAPPVVRPVRAIVVHAAAVAGSDTYAGEVRARYESTLGFRVGGKIAARRVDVGDTVHAGQVLAQLDQRDLTLQLRSSEAAVAARQADFDVAKADLQRYENLVGPGYVSHSEYDRQRSTFDAAKAQLDAAQAQARESRNQLAYGALKADHDGVITSVLAEVGQVVAAGQGVMTLAHSGELEVDTSVPEGQVGQLHVGDDVTVHLTGLDGSAAQGVIRRIASNADPATRTYDIRVRLPDAPPALRLGMTTTVTLQATSKTTTFRLPLTALFPCQPRACVWVIDAKTSTVKSHPVTLAGAAGNDVLVGDGISDGDLVVTAGASLLHPDEKVRRLDPAEDATPLGGDGQGH